MDNQLQSLEFDEINRRLQGIFSIPLVYVAEFPSKTAVLIPSVYIKSNTDISFFSNNLISKLIKDFNIFLKPHGFKVYGNYPHENFATLQVQKLNQNLSNLIQETVSNLFNDSDYIAKKSEVENFRHQLAQSLGIVLELYFVNSEGGPALKLPLIKVPNNMQRQGKGTQAMKSVIEFADEKGYRIFLTPSTDWGSSKTGLLRFYKSFGFIPHSGRNRDYHFKDDMVRMPK